MPLSLEAKKAVVAEVSAVAAESCSAVAAEYRGLTVAQMNDLRVKAREKGVYLRVVRNTLARRALDGTEFECMREGLVGPLLLAFAREEPGSAARVVRDFAKDNDKLVVLGGALEDKVLNETEVKALATLPSLDEQRATLIGLLQAPATKIAGVLQAPAAQLARVFGAYAAKDAA